MPCRKGVPKLQMFGSCRKHEEDIRDTQVETAHINQVIVEKDAEMAELKRLVAQGRPASAGASASARAAASSSQKHGSRGKADDDSPKSNMSSPWGTDVSLLTHKTHHTSFLGTSGCLLVCISGMP